MNAEEGESLAGLEKMGLTWWCCGWLRDFGGLGQIFLSLYFGVVWPWFVNVHLPPSDPGTSDTVASPVSSLAPAPVQHQHGHRPPTPVQFRCGNGKGWATA